MSAVVQPGVGSEAVGHRAPDGGAAARRPSHPGADPPAVPGHPERVPHPGDGDGERLQEAHRPRAARGGSVLPGATPPGGRRLLQHLQRRRVRGGVALPQPGTPEPLRYFSYSITSDQSHLTSMSRQADSLLWRHMCGSTSKNSSSQSLPVRAGKIIRGGGEALPTLSSHVGEERLSLAESRTYLNASKESGLLLSLRK